MCTIFQPLGFLEHLRCPLIMGRKFLALMVVMMKKKLEQLLLKSLAARSGLSKTSSVCGYSFLVMQSRKTS